MAAAIVFTALNLRTAIASVPPLLDEIRADVPLSATAAGVLTTCAGDLHGRRLADRAAAGAPDRHRGRRHPARADDSPRAS